MKLLVPRTKSGVEYWRTWVPLKELERRGKVEIRTFDAKSFLPAEVSAGLKWCDAVVFRGCADIAGLDLLRKYQELGKPCIVDQDDFNFDVDPLNPAYKRFGTEEIEVETEHGRSWLWKDGVDGFDLKKNRMKAGAGIAILQEAAVVTTTTPYLKQKFQALSGRGDIFVIPNAINKDIWKPMSGARDKYKDGFRFGWFISDSHASDLLYIRETLKKFLLAHKDAKLVILGDYGGIDLNGYFPEDQVETIPFLDLYELHYPIIASCLGLDVAIAPLAYTEFNRCKSPLKFAEYTAWGYPTILENIETYAPYVVDGETALLAGSPEEWTIALEQMYSNKDLRAKIRFNAPAVVDALFDIRKVALDWETVFRSVMRIQKI